MGDPVQNKTVKAVPPVLLAEKKGVTSKCPEGKYFRGITEDGKDICKPTLGVLPGDPMTCGEKEGGFPCDFGNERFGIPKKTSASPPPPPPQDQFKPAAPKELTRLITGKAEYDCKTQMPHTEHWTIHREVTVTAAPNEPETNTRARLEQAARDLAKTIGGCREVTFLRLQPGAKESAKAVIPPPRSPAPAQTDSMSEFNRLCGAGGKWENRSICRR